MAKLILFVLPLGLDTFAVAAALGVAGLPARQRLKISLLMSGFEVVMPLIGLLLGRGLGSTTGSAADYLAVAVLLTLGGYLLVSGEDQEQEKVAALVGNQGVALLALGLSISLDELAMGFTIGLAPPLPPDRDRPDRRPSLPLRPARPSPRHSDRRSDPRRDREARRRFNDRAWPPDPGREADPVSGTGFALQGHSHE